MKSLDLKTLLLGGSLLAGTFAYSTMGYAQETTETTDDVIELVDEEVEEKESDNIIVTGSRLSRDSFTSVSPLQVIDAELSRDLGLVEASQILQTATVAAGTQIDTTFGGFVLDNGPGAETVDLRGLGANRNLILLNGRRVAPAGIEGAPSSPDLSLLPSGLIQKYDIVLDGASAIYGSDAIAGVVNAVLKTDVEGFEVTGSYSLPEQTNGQQFAVDATYGINSDRGFVMVGASYRKSEEVKYRDRDFLNNCNTNLEVTTEGEIRTVDVSSTIGQRPDECKIQGLAGRILAPLFGSIYNRGDGTGNLIIPGFSESSQFGVGFDQNLDGVADVTFQDFAINGRDLDRSLFPENERYNIAAFGEYTFEGDSNVTPFFELVYSKRKTTSANTGDFQLFPVVPANNPFNPCNPAAAGGVDCGLAYTAMLTDPIFVNQFQDYYFGGAGSPNCFGFPRSICTPATFGLLSGPIGAQTVQPVVSVEGDRTRVTADIEQLRGVFGLRADLPQINFGGFQNWSGEAYVSISRSTGNASRPGIRGDRLNYALGVGSTAPCVTAAGATVSADVSNGCVPVNLFADSLYAGVVGDFATQAERDYLFDSRDFLTEVDQTIWNVFLQGDIAETAAGTVSLGFGGEVRVDAINSVPDDIARDGLFFGFFSDEGANGSKVTKEVFAEMFVPLVADKPFFKRLNLELSGRVTKDEFYPTAFTYSAKSEWSPFDALTLKGTVGTSYRAPNVRENFLNSQTGFSNFSDPCFAPDLAVDPITGAVTGVDGRTQQTLDNCIAAGIDPTTFGLGQVAVNAEIGRGGATDLSEEQSQSFTAGFAFEQPWLEDVDVTVGATYWNVNIDNTIIEPSGQFLINECYINQPLQSSPFCSRITRDATQNISFIDGGFINRDNETAEGVDVNVRYRQEVTVFERPITLRANINATRLIERNTVQSIPGQAALVETFVGEQAFPKWQAQGIARLTYDDFTFAWQTRFLGSIVADQDILADDIFGSTADGLAQTCSGVAAGDVDCRNVNTIDSYFVHGASIVYRNDDWSIGGGVRNIFDKAPPRIDTASIFGRNNTPLGSGYDLNGRVFFVNARKSFR